MVNYSKLAIGALFFLGGAAAGNGTAKDGVEGGTKSVRGIKPLQTPELEDIRRKLSTTLAGLKEDLELDAASDAGDIETDGSNPTNVLSLWEIYDLLVHYDEAICRAGGLADVNVGGIKTGKWDQDPDHRHAHNHAHAMPHTHNHNHVHGMDHVHEHNHKHSIAHHHTGFDFTGCTVDIRCGDSAPIGQTTGPTTPDAMGNSAGPDPTRTLGPINGDGSGRTMTDNLSDANQGYEVTSGPKVPGMAATAKTETNGFASGDTKDTTRTAIDHSHDLNFFADAINSQLNAIGDAVKLALNSETCNLGNFPEPGSHEWPYANCVHEGNQPAVTGISCVAGATVGDPGACCAGLTCTGGVCTDVGCSTTACTNDSDCETPCNVDSGEAICVGYLPEILAPSPNGRAEVPGNCLVNASP